MRSNIQHTNPSKIQISSNLPVSMIIRHSVPHCVPVWMETSWDIQKNRPRLTTKEVSAGPLWLRLGPAMPGWCFTCHRMPWPQGTLKFGLVKSCEFPQMFGDICDVTRVSKGFDIQNTLRIIVQQQKMLNPVAMSYIYTYIYVCVCVFLWPDSCDFSLARFMWLALLCPHMAVHKNGAYFFGF